MIKDPLSDQKAIHQILKNILIKWQNRSPISVNHTESESGCDFARPHLSDPAELQQTMIISAFRDRKEPKPADASSPQGLEKTRIITRSEKMAIQSSEDHRNKGPRVDPADMEKTRLIRKSPTDGPGWPPNPQNRSGK